MVNKNDNPLKRNIKSIFDEVHGNLIHRQLDDNILLRDIFTCSIHIHLLLTDEKHDLDYWGSEHDIDVGNHTYKCICDYLDYDINDQGVFSSIYLKSTPIEIAIMNLATLLYIHDPVLSKLIIDNKEKALFTVAFESCMCDFMEWEQILKKDIYYPDSFRLFNQDNISTNSGWSNSQSKELNSLEIYETLHCYGNHSHTLIRII